MSLLAVCGAAMVTAAACLLLEERERRYVLLAAGLLLLLQCLAPLRELLGFLRESGGDWQESLKPLCKGVGVGCLCGVCASVLRESGGGNAAKLLELYARLQILLLSLPLLRQLLQIVRELLCEN